MVGIVYKNELVVGDKTIPWAAEELYSSNPLHLTTVQLDTEK